MYSLSKKRIKVLLKNLFGVRNILISLKVEGSARVIKEAMSYNLKIICTNNSGNKMIDKKGNIFSYVKKMIQNIMQKQSLIYKIKEFINQN